MTEENFAHELERRAEHVYGDMRGGPVSFEDVRGKARQIRRRHRAGAAVAAAAVAALVVLVPATLGVGGQGRITPDPAKPAATLIPQADGSYRLTLDAPSDDAPDVPYIDFQDGTLAMPDGRVVLSGDWTQVLPYDDGWVAVSGQKGAELDGDLEPVRTFEAGLGGMTITDDGGRLAWVEREGDQWIAVNASSSGGGARTPMATEIAPVGFLPDDSLVVEGTEGGEAWIVAIDGTVTDFGGFQWVNDSSPATGLVAVQTDFRGGDTACSAVVDSTNRQPYWEKCGWSLGQFSPDGRYIVAFGAREGPLPTRMAVLDAATGDPVVEFSGAEAGDTVWEDDETLLAAVVEHGHQAILRLGINGSVSRASERVGIEPMSVRLWFTSQARE